MVDVAPLKAHVNTLRRLKTAHSLQKYERRKINCLTLLSYLVFFVSSVVEYSRVAVTAETARKEVSLSSGVLHASKLA